MAMASKPKGILGMAGFGPFASPGAAVDPNSMQGLSDLLAEFKAPRGNLADGAGLLGGILMDLDGTMGAGNMKAQTDRFDRFRQQEAQRFAAQQQKQIMARAAGGDEYALALMDPLGNRDYQTGRVDRKEDLGREDQAIQREEGWKLKDFLRTLERDTVSDDQWTQEFGEGKRQFGVNEDLAREGLDIDRAGLDLKGLQALLSAQGDAATDEGQLRREYLAQNKNFLEMQQAYGKIRSIDTSTAAGQMGLVFSLMKLYDPTSSVREQEYANASNAAGVPAKIRNQWNNLKNGKFLDEDNQVPEFLAAAEDLYGSALQDFERSYTTYKDQVAPGYGFDTDRTIPDLRDQTIQMERALASIDRTTASGQVVSPDGVKLLLQELSPETMDEFDADFGRGSASRILQQLGVPAPERVRPRTYDIPR